MFLFCLYCLPVSFPRHSDVATSSIVPLFCFGHAGANGAFYVCMHYINLCPL